MSHTTSVWDLGWPSPHILKLSLYIIEATVGPDVKSIKAFTQPRETCLKPCHDTFPKPYNYNVYTFWSSHKDPLTDRLGIPSCP